MISPTNYFSGFCFKNEASLFDEYLNTSSLTVAGFSYGAQKAFEMALQTNSRIDTLQLFSPAFFQTQDEKYKRMQLMFFKKDSQTYCENFLNNTLYPSQKNVASFFSLGTYDELNELLHYVWDEAKLQRVVDKGIKIEVYLGFEDKIIDSRYAYEFFKPFASVYGIKNVGHIL